jgi:hypothetical protein
VNPTRLLDTRYENGLPEHFRSKSPQTFQVTLRGGIPSRATAVAGNLTVTGQSSPGYLYLGPVATSSPTSSTLNFPLDDNRANAAIVPLGAGGSLSITYAGGANATSDAIFDVTGYFAP